ncbi:MAG: RNA polymerase factor sigma-32 [Deltaproteobacteria bacterium]|jgi:RNA polymerase sigma-32 factor|nr:RNA polymerase factor sigma-32 [Deltaproteobacteria bacterium]
MMALNNPEDLKEDFEIQETDEKTSLAKVDPLQRYLVEVRRYKLLTKEEEHQLALTYRENKDPDAAYKLVTGNLRLVVKIAFEFHRAWVMNLLDLIQEGNIGLMQAVKKFDPYRGVRLSSYASFWIRAYILRFILDNWRLVKIGTTQAQRRLFFNLQKEKTKLEALGYSAEPKKLAEAIGVKEKEVIQMDQRMSSWEASLDAPMRDDAARSLMDFLPASKELIDGKLEDNEIKSILYEKLKDFKKTLKDKELYIYENRILAENPATLQEIGDKYGVTRERTRQIEERLLRKIKDFLKEEIPGIEDYQIKNDG